MAPLIFWMLIQIIVGIWLFISPYVLGDGEMSAMTTNSMVIGAIVALVGLGVAFFSKAVCGYEHAGEKRAT